MCNKISSIVFFYMVYVYIYYVGYIPHYET